MFEFGGVPKSFCGWLRDNGLLFLRTGSRGFQYVTKIAGASAGTIAMILPSKEEEP